MAAAFSLKKETVRKLFGSEDAESESIDRFKEYFVSNSAYEDLSADLPLHIVVGHKGTGKSALLRRSFLDDVDNGVLAVEIQPNDISELMTKVPSESFIQSIERWKTGIKRIVSQKAVQSLAESGFEIIPNELIQSAGRTLTSSLMNVVRLIRPNITDSITQSIADKFLDKKIVRVYIDDIDRGWSASASDISNISALVNACRDLCNSDKGFQCRIALRTDVYFLVRTSDESTDKIEQNIIRLQWSNDDILRLMAVRILSFFGESRNEFELANLSQARIAKEILSKVIDPVFQGRGIWENVPVSIPLMSLCRKRPRDLIKLFHGAASIANRNKRIQISTKDLSDSFELYSTERLQDLVNEFKSELPFIEQLILRFRPTKVERRSSMSFLYTTDELVKKIRNIRTQVPLSFRSGRIVSETTILMFLYKIDFLIARNDSNGESKWSYFDQRRFLANDAVDFGFKWEVHPAYRWAIQPNDIQDVISSLSIDTSID